MAQAHEDKFASDFYMLVGEGKIDAGKVMAKLMSSMMNSYSGENAKSFVESMLCEHRTLQQTFMSSIVLDFIKKVAKLDKNMHFDGRNDAMKTVCDLLFEALKKEGIENCGLPLV